MIFLNKDILLSNIDKIHTTEMGIDRIKKNLKLNTNDVVEFCKNKILDNSKTIVPNIPENDLSVINSRPFEHCIKN